MYFLDPMCFLCLKSSKEDLSDICSIDENGLTCLEKISCSLTKIIVVMKQNFDYKICKKCSETVNMIYNFNESCLRNINTLSSYVDILEQKCEKNRRAITIELNNSQYINKNKRNLEVLRSNYSLIQEKTINTSFVNCKNISNSLEDSTKKFSDFCVIAPTNNVEIEEIDMNTDPLFQESNLEDVEIKEELENSCLPNECLDTYLTNNIGNEQVILEFIVQKPVPTVPIGPKVHLGKDKKRRKVLPFGLKLKIIKLFEQGNGKVAISKKLNISEATIRGVLKNTEKYRELSQSVSMLSINHSCRIKKSIIIEMEDLLLHWIHDCNQKGVPIDREKVTEKALSIFYELKETKYYNEDVKFTASKFWFQKFKVRTGIINADATEEVACPEADILTQNNNVTIQPMLQVGGSCLNFGNETNDYGNVIIKEEVEDSCNAYEGFSTDVPNNIKPEVLDVEPENTPTEEASLLQPVTGKKKRRVYSLDTKFKIIKLFENGNSKVAIAKRLDINESTVRGVLKQRNKCCNLSKTVSTFSVKQSCRNRPPLMIELEDMLLVWIQHCNREEIAVRTEEIKNQAMKLFHALKEEKYKDADVKFSASKGWFGKFKRRLDLKSKKPTGYHIMNITT